MRRPLVLCVFAFLAACGGDSATGVTPNVAGIYTLRSINSSALPVVVQRNGADFATLLDDAYTLSADGKYTELWHLSLVQSGATTMQTRTDTGTFTLDGVAIRLAGPQFGLIEAYLLPDTLLLVDDVGQKVYTR